jgi:hypothetical protein
MADPRITQIIRDAGGIVHSDGNIFFTNQAQFLQAATQAQQPAQQTDLPRKPDSLPVVLNMLRETKGGSECRLPTPACWDLTQYVASLEAALLAAIGKLAASTQPAMSQDAQPVAPLASFAHEVVLGAYSEDELPDAAMRALKRAGYASLSDVLNGTHPPIPQAGKVLEALTNAVRLAQTEIENITDTEQRILDDASDALALLRSRVQGGLSTNNEEMK